MVLNNGLKGFFVWMSPLLMQRQRCRGEWIWREFVGEGDPRILALCVQSRQIVHGCSAALWEASDKRKEQPPEGTTKFRSAEMSTYDCCKMVLSPHLTGCWSCFIQKRLLYHMRCLITGHGLFSTRFLPGKGSIIIFFSVEEFQSPWSCLEVSSAVRSLIRLRDPPWARLIWQQLVSCCCEPHSPLWTLQHILYGSLWDRRNMIGHHHCNMEIPGQRMDHFRAFNSGMMTSPTDGQ